LVRERRPAWPDAALRLGIGSVIPAAPVATGSRAALAYRAHAGLRGAGIGLLVIPIARASLGISDQVVALIPLPVEHLALLVGLAFAALFALLAYHLIAVLPLVSLTCLTVGVGSVLLLLKLLLTGLLALLLRRLAARILIHVTAV